MAFGFNTDVVVGEHTYHVQTEAPRSRRTVETTVFRGGAVCHSRISPLPPGDSDVAQLIREQHATIIRELQSGVLPQPREE